MRGIPPLASAILAAASRVNIIRFEPAALRRNAM